jgi:putative phage-type endonuclease
MTSKQVLKTLDTDFHNGAKLLGDAVSGSAEWHELRSRGIGGSDIGTIMGLNPWESAFSLWAKRTGQIPNPPIDNWSIRFGKAFEEPILRLWWEQNPEWDVYLAGTYQHPKVPYLLANPDALAHNPVTDEWIVVEVKTARSHWGDVPPAYRAQVMHYMDVFGVDRGVIVAVAGWAWEEREIVRDQFEVDTQRASAARFWEHLQETVKPEWDGSKSTYEAERHLHPSIAEEEVAVGQLGVDLMAAQFRFDDAEAKLLQAKSRVLDKMGSARHATTIVNGQPVRVASRQARANGVPWLVVKRNNFE